MNPRNSISLQHCSRCFLSASANLYLYNNVLRRHCICSHISTCLVISTLQVKFVRYKTIQRPPLPALGSVITFSNNRIYSEASKILHIFCNSLSCVCINAAINPINCQKNIKLQQYFPIRKQSIHNWKHPTEGGSR